MQHESPPMPQVPDTVVPHRPHRPARGHPAGGARAGRRRRAAAAARPGRQAAGRQHGADARLQRLDPRPHPEGPAGLGGHRPRHQRRRPRHHRALARAAAGEQVRRRAARDPGRRSRSAAASPTASGSPTPACTGTTRTSARTTPRRWACTATSWSSPPSPDYWPPAHRDVVLTLDDLLLEDGKIAPFSRSRRPTTRRWAGSATCCSSAARPTCALTARAGEVVRLWLTNTANTRVFNVRLPGARMKLVGGDSGRVEHEEFVSEVLLAPSERAVVDVLFDRPGQLTLEHRTPDRTYRLAAITVTGEPAEPPLAERVRGAAHRRRSWPPSGSGSTRGWPRRRTRSLRWSRRWTTSQRTGTGPAVYACPMHPEVTSDQPGRCPKCGMKLLATAVPTVRLPDAGTSDGRARDHAGRCHRCGDDAASAPGRTARATRAATARARTASSGKTTWWRSTG